MLPDDLGTLGSLRQSAKQVQRSILRRLPPASRARVTTLARYVRSHMPERENARIVEGPYSALRTAEENLRAVVDLLDSWGIPFVAIPGSVGERSRLVVPEEYGGAVGAALRELPLQDGWNFSFRLTLPSAKYSPQRSMAGYRTGDGPRDFRVARRLLAPNGRRLDTRRESVEIFVWTRLGDGVERVDGGNFRAGTLHKHPQHPWTPVSYLEPDEWRRWYEARHQMSFADAAEGHVPLDAVVEPIDVVYTWVDGSDPAWRERKAQALGDFDAAGVNESADAESRYISRDELLYSLRSLEMYADWVRNIYIVTDQQVPSWLNTENSRIHVVDHRDIFTNTEVLPVYNSHAIESQLHHIEGLSERYLYLNDDVFFGRPTDPSLFFTGAGMSKFFLSRAVLDVADPTARDLPVLSAAKRNRDLVSNEFGRRVAQKFKHTPHAQVKEVLQELEDRFPEHFARVAASRIRHPEDLSITSSLHHYWAYCSGRSIEGRIRYDYFDLVNEDAQTRLSQLPFRRDLDTFCINDTSGEPDAVHRNDEHIRDTLAELFPLPSSFELR